MEKRRQDDGVTPISFQLSQRMLAAYSSEIFRIS